MRMDVRQRVAAELRAEMGRQQRSQTELAVAAGVSQSTVSRWMRGEADMSLTELASVVNFLGIKIGAVLGDEPSGDRAVAS